MGWGLILNPAPNQMRNSLYKAVPAGAEGGSERPSTSHNPMVHNSVGMFVTLHENVCNKTHNGTNSALSCFTCFNLNRRHHKYHFQEKQHAKQDNQKTRLLASARWSWQQTTDQQLPPPAPGSPVNGRKDRTHFWDRTSHIRTTQSSPPLMMVLVFVATTDIAVPWCPATLAATAAARTHMRQTQGQKHHICMTHMGREREWREDTNTKKQIERHK